MGLLLLVLRKSLGIILFTLIFIVLPVLILNYDPVMNLLPQGYSLRLCYIRRAVNECIPLIAALIVGIFAQGVVIVYRLYEKAIQEHLKELSEVAKTLFNKMNEIGEPAYFSSSTSIVGGYQLYIHIKSPLCDRYREVVKDYEDLVKDIGNHWKEAGKVLNKVNELCKNINQHNNRVKDLEKELEESLSNHIRGEIVPILPGVDSNHLKNFMIFILLSEVVPKIVSRGKKFEEIGYNDIDEIYRNYNPTLESRDGSLFVAGYNVGNVTPNDWRKHENLIVKTIHDVLKEYSERLDELLEEGQRLIKNSELINKELKESLKLVKDAKILPIVSCKYLK